MKSTIRSRAIKALLLSAMMLCTFEISSGQESDVDATAPPRITQDLISRSELNRLLHQPPQDRNPLRRTVPQPSRRQLQLPRRQLQPQNQGTFHDPNVQPASWQEEQPAPPAVVPISPVAPVAPVIKPQQFDSTIGPAISPAMQSMWNMQDMLVEIPIERLQQEIAERRASVESSLSIDDNSKMALQEQIEIAETAAQQAIQNAQGKADFQKRMVNLPDDIERLRQNSKQPLAPSPMARNLTIESMQILLGNLQAESDQKRSNLKKIQDRIQQRDDRMAVIPLERQQNRTRVNVLHEEFLRKQARGTEDIETLLALRAKELEASTKIQLLDTEAGWHDQSQEKLPLEKAIHQQQLQRLEQDINAWNMAIANQKQSELETQIRLARQKAIEAHPALKEFSKETTKLAQARADLAAKIGALQNEQLKVGKQIIDVDDQFDRLDKSISKNGKEQSRELLTEVHRNLIRPYEGMARVRKIASEETLARGTITKLRAERDKTNDPETFILEQLNIQNDEQIADTTLIVMAKDAIETYRTQLTAIIGDNEEYLGLLNQVRLQREPLLKKIEATRELVDTHALWVQSADPFSVELIAKSGQGAKEFFDREQWRSLGDSIINRVTHRPYESAVGMIGLCIAFVVGRRFKG